MALQHRMFSYPEHSAIRPASAPDKRGFSPPATLQAERVRHHHAEDLEHRICVTSAFAGSIVRLKEVIDPTSLDLFVARGSAVFGPAGSSPIPEPSIWAMLALGLPRPRRPRPPVEALGPSSTPQFPKWLIRK